MSRKPTKAQQKRLDALHQMPCMACVKEGVEQPFPTEAHHIVDKGYRKHSGGHDATLPLCAWHHRGLQKDGWLKIEMEARYGVSMALNKRAFEAKHETQRVMLSRVNTLLGFSGVKL